MPYVIWLLIDRQKFIIELHFQKLPRKRQCLPETTSLLLRKQTWSFTRWATYWGSTSRHLFPSWMFPRPLTWHMDWIVLHLMVYTLYARLNIVASGLCHEWSRTEQQVQAQDQAKYGLGPKGEEDQGRQVGEFPDHPEAQMSALIIWINKGWPQAQVSNG